MSLVHVPGLNLRYTAPTQHRIIAGRQGGLVVTLERC